MNNQNNPKDLSKLSLYKEINLDTKINQLKISKNQKLIIIGDSNGNIIFYNIENFTLINSFNFGITSSVTTFTEIEFLSKENPKFLFLAIGYPKNIIKIIKFALNENSIIEKSENFQEITLANDSHYIQHIIEAKTLKLISGDYNNIAILKYEEKFETEKIIPMKHVVDCLIDINENIFCACQYYFKCVKFFDKKSYKNIKSFYDIKISTFCNNIMKNIDEKILIVCCEDGLVIFDLVNLQIIQRIILKNKITYIADYYENNNVKYFLCSSFYFDKRINPVLLMLIFDEVEIELIGEKKEIHKGVISTVNYISSKNLIITSGSEDKCIKIWTN